MKGKKSSCKRIKEIRQREYEQKVKQSLLDSLQGCICRMCVTGDIEELDVQREYAIYYLSELHRWNEKRIVWGNTNE